MNGVMGKEERRGMSFWIIFQLLWYRLQKHFVSFMDICFLLAQISGFRLLLVVLSAQGNSLWAFELETDIQKLLGYPLQWHIFLALNHGDSPSFSTFLHLILPKFKRLIGGGLEALMDLGHLLQLEPCQLHFRLKNLLSLANCRQSTVNEC